MLPNQSVSNFPAPAVTWSEVARACRRVCVLRERGLKDEAEQVRAEQVMPMVALLRTATDTDAAITERLNGVFAAEAERVANAAVLAELLVPELTGQLRSLVAPVSAPVSPAPPPAAPVAAAKPTPPRRGSIADFIDDMIAQEDPPDRPGRGAQRRAS